MVEFSNPHHMRKYVAEFIGTFALAYAVSMSLAGNFPVPTPVLAALTLGLFVYTIGHISGTHLNPAITIGLLSINKIKLMDAVYYIIAQFAGAGLAYYLSGRMVARAVLTVTDTPWVLLAEGLGALFFGFGVAAVAYGRVQKDLAGVVVGGSLLLGISFSALMNANGVLNPAVALGIGSFGMMYILGPVIGASLGMWIYKYVSGEKN